MTAYGTRSARSAVRLLVPLTILSTCLTALVGILASYDGGIFSGWEVQVIGTPLVMAFIGIATLCYLATAGTRYWGVGVLGGLVMGLTAAYTLRFIWDQNFRGHESDTRVRAHTVGLILTIALAQIALLFGLAGDRPRLRVALWPTIALSVATTALAVSLAVNEAPMTDTEFRTLVALTIANALGTLTTLALSLIGIRSRAQEAPLTARPRQ